MECYAGLDVSLELTSVCIMGADGKIVREGKVATDPGEIGQYLHRAGVALKRVGLEAGATTQWLYGGLAKAGLPVVCIETRHAKAAMAAMMNKTDRNDARGIANMMRTGWFRAVHVKTEAAQELRFLLTARQTLMRKLINIVLTIRGMLRSFGLKMGKVQKRQFEARVRELAGDRPNLMKALRPMLKARQSLADECENLSKITIMAARDDQACRRLMTVPGVGSIVALTYRATIDVPARFKRSRAVGAHLGLTPRTHQSGELDRTGRISKTGDGMARTALYEAAHVLLTRVKRACALRSWGLRLQKNRGHKRAVTAVARQLAVVMHRIWADGVDFNWGAPPKSAPAAPK